MSSPTEELCKWAASLQLSDIPSKWLERAKYLLLDGIACALTGPALPTSDKATQAVSLMEPLGGTASVIGHPNLKLTPCSAAMLNSSYIQGFELDDWHRDAPIHANSILIPALTAAAEHRSVNATFTNSKSTKTSGADILLSLIIGYEVGPRVGKALHGRHILSQGWHSGVIFGGAAAAAAVARLYELDAGATEDAIGIACTQTGGLMSAQFESDVKRMQHGFAARNGLLGVFLAQSGYVGIKRVFERDYGGFLDMFSKGNGKEPRFLPEEVCKDLGEKWMMEGICVKPYATMAGTHMTIDCVRALQHAHPDLLEKEMLAKIQSITIRCDELIFKRAGWKAERPLRDIGAQMNATFAAATQLVEHEVLAAQFRSDKLESDAIWELILKSHCEMKPDFPASATEVEIVFDDGMSIKHYTRSQRGVSPPMSNEEVVEKWRVLAKDTIDEERMKKIERMVLNIESEEDVTSLVELLTPETKDPSSENLNCSGTKICSRRSDTVVILRISKKDLCYQLSTCSEVHNDEQNQQLLPKHASLNMSAT